MMEAKICFEAPVEEETRGSSEFGFWRCIRDMFFNTRSLADEINAATEAAYSEGGTNL